MSYRRGRDRRWGMTRRALLFSSLATLAPLLPAGCGSVGAGEPPADAPPADAPPDAAPRGETLWTYAFGDSSGDSVQCARLAEDGHAILLGEVNGSVTIGGTEIVTPPGGRSSYFVARLDGGVARTPTVIRYITQNGASCGADAAGRLAIAGTLTSGTASFGSQSVTTSIAYSAFHAMFTANGALQWVRTAGDNEAYGGGAAVDRQGNVYVTHLFSGSANLGGPTHIAGNFDALIGRLGSDGSYQASFHRGGAGHDEAVSIEVDGSGNILVAGQYYDTTNYGGATLPDPYVEREAFIAKLTPQGGHVFSRSLASPGQDYYPRLDLDERNQVWISQPFQGTLDLGGGRTLTSKGANDLAIIHLDAGGDVLAAWSVGGADDEHPIAHDLAADGEDVVLYFTVGASGAVIDGVPVGGQGGRDAVVARFSGSGQLIAARTLGTPGEDIAMSIDAGPGGYLLAGAFGGGLTRAQLAFDNAVLTSQGGADGFAVMLRREALR